MIELVAPFITQIFSGFATSECSLRADGWREAEIHPEMKPRYAKLGCLVGIEQFKNIFDDGDLQTRVWRLQRQLEGNENFTGEMLARELNGLNSQALMCLSKHKFAYIPPPNDQYFEREKLFGDLVDETLPEGRNDIKDAGNCIAASLYTASVFHLMRVSEYGLRALAKRLRVKLNVKGKQIPIEYGTWNEVITNCNNRIGVARQKHVGAKKQLQLNLYSEAADHCTFMKDIWRNDLSHTRKPYIHDEALAVFGRVRDFMLFLAGVLEARR
jgi:hypothetical protein